MNDEINADNQTKLNRYSEIMTSLNLIMNTRRTTKEDKQGFNHLITELRTEHFKIIGIKDLKNMTNNKQKTLRKISLLLNDNQEILNALVLNHRWLNNRDGDIRKVLSQDTLKVILNKSNPLKHYLTKEKNDYQVIDLNEIEYNKFNAFFR